MESIVCNGIGKIYGKKQVLKNINLTLEKGQKLPEGYDVTIQPLNLEKLFVSLCGMEE